jgi:hypothetical protein
LNVVPGTDAGAVGFFFFFPPSSQIFYFTCFDRDGFLDFCLVRMPVVQRQVA